MIETIIILGCTNHVIKYAPKKCHLEVAKLLLAHPKVKNSLSKEDYKRYYAQIN